MNITILLDRSYRSLSPVTTNLMYRFLYTVLERLSVKTSNKFRVGAYGQTMSFLCPKVQEIRSHPRTDFVYSLKSHNDTPHQTWTEDTKAELLFLIKGHPFHCHGHNNIRDILTEVTQGAAPMAADHVVILAHWPIAEARDMLTVMRETASVTFINLHSRNALAPDRVAENLESLTQKTLLIKKSKCHTPYEKLQQSMLLFLTTRAPQVLAETYGHPPPPCAGQESDCSAKTCD
jgi:hypothetical protein